MSKQEQIEQLNNLIDELEQEMWYNIHADAPHKAAQVKRWNDQLKDQAAALHIQINNQKNIK